MLQLSSSAPSKQSATRPFSAPASPSGSHFPAQKRRTARDLSPASTGGHRLQDASRSSAQFRSNSAPLMKSASLGSIGQPSSPTSPTSPLSPARQRPGLGWDYTSTGLVARRLQCQAADGYVAAQGRSIALDSKKLTKCRDGQRRALPRKETRDFSETLATLDHIKKSSTDPTTALSTAEELLQMPYPEPRSPMQAKYYTLHPRERKQLFSSSAMRGLAVR
mmetsp:Transcript_98404/g.175226  ORF Transcript_98404/g.175226 Transcript_98404/m.175226 type:complete len:221 (+) Transcript_98404:26-688(+)